MSEPGSPHPDQTVHEPVDEPFDDTEQVRRPGSRRKQQRRGPGVGCLAVLVVLLLVVGGLYFAATRGIDALESRFGGDSAEDFPGPGSGRVAFVVSEGDNAGDIAAGLVEEDVVASTEAFTAVAAADERSTTIQVGTYEMRREMSAADALELLVDTGNLITNSVTIPEGLRVEDVVDVLAEGTGVPARRFERVLEDPDAIGLPDYAGGDAEGYLFPATYDFGEDPSPRQVLRTMVERWRQAADSADLEARASALDYTPGEVMTVASLVESEASRPEDRARVARVIYNRLEGDETDGLLQLDATVNYASGEDLGARTTEEDRQIDSPYNTYLVPGLPPGPIEAPGDAAIEAAANPADGDWFYYVTVDLATGETKFAETFEEHSRNVDELNEYCTTSDAC